MIQRILDEEGVPQELIHLAQAESGFIPRAMSSKAAGGMWQFVKFRGQEYGLTQTKYTDERMDPEKATRAAARHLHDLYNQFGDWYLAIAAYNCGPGAVQRAVERTGYADFWELRRRAVLPAETTNYVPIILAMTIMEKNAAEYGLTGIQFDPPIEYDTVDDDVAHQPGAGFGCYGNFDGGVGDPESRGSEGHGSREIRAACSEGDRQPSGFHVCEASSGRASRFVAAAPRRRGRKPGRDRQALRGRAERHRFRQQPGCFRSGGRRPAPDSGGAAGGGSAS